MEKTEFQILKNIHDHNERGYTLISDNELRIRLNKGGRYFYSEGKKVGHPFLKEIEKQMLPYWLNYLKRKQKNIIYFYKQLEKIIKVENSV